MASITIRFAKVRKRTHISKWSVSHKVVERLHYLAETIAARGGAVDSILMRTKNRYKSRHLWWDICLKERKVYYNLLKYMLCCDYGSET